MALNSVDTDQQSKSRPCQASVGDLESNAMNDDDLSLEQLYQKAKDEAELLEFKNYELMFKIQELESNQIEILNHLSVGSTADSDCGEATAAALAADQIKFKRQPESEIDDNDHESSSSLLTMNNNKQQQQIHNQSQKVATLHSDDDQHQLAGRAQTPTEIPNPKGHEGEDSAKREAKSRPLEFGAVAACEQQRRRRRADNNNAENANDLHAQSSADDNNHQRLPIELAPTRQDDQFTGEQNGNEKSLGSSGGARQLADDDQAGTRDANFKTTTTTTATNKQRANEEEESRPPNVVVVVGGGGESLGGIDNNNQIDVGSGEPIVAADHQHLARIEQPKITTTTGSTAMRDADQLQQQRKVKNAKDEYETELAAFASPNSAALGSSEISPLHDLPDELSSNLGQRQQLVATGEHHRWGESERVASSLVVAVASDGHKLIEYNGDSPAAARHRRRRKQATTSSCPADHETTENLNSKSCPTGEVESGSLVNECELAGTDNDDDDDHADHDGQQQVLCEEDSELSIVCGSKSIGDQPTNSSSMAATRTNKCNLAKSQPNLAYLSSSSGPSKSSLKTTTTAKPKLNQNQKCVPTGSARIAMPVQKQPVVVPVKGGGGGNSNNKSTPTVAATNPRSHSSQNQIKMPKLINTSRARSRSINKSTVVAGTTTRTTPEQDSYANNYLRTRSKSSLDLRTTTTTAPATTSLLPRRLSSTNFTAATKQPGGQVRLNGPKTSSPNVVGSGNPAAAVQAQRQAQSQLPVHLSKSTNELANLAAGAANKKLQTKRTNRSSLGASNQVVTLSSSTQIPTLISQSHVQPQSVNCPAKFAANTSRLDGDSGAKINEAEPENELQTLASNCDEQEELTLAQQQQQHTEPDEVAATIGIELETNRPLETKELEQTNRPTEQAECELPGEPLHQFAEAPSQRQEVDGRDDDDDQLANQRQEIDQFEVAKESPAACSSLPGKQPLLFSAENDDDQLVASKLSRDTRTNSCWTLADMQSANGEQKLATLARDEKCDQCKLFGEKLKHLLEEQKQTNEQLMELEELENDSRSLSQKLAQQVLKLEQQLDSCKFKLQTSGELESKLRFQNKRLSFELKQRQDYIEQLQFQLTELKSRVKCLLKSPGKTAATFRQHEDEHESKVSIGGEPAEASQPAPHSPTNESSNCSVGSIESAQPSNHGNLDGKQSLSTSNLSSANSSDGSNLTTISLNTSDDDSAIDVYELNHRHHNHHQDGPSAKLLKTSDGSQMNKRTLSSSSSSSCDESDHTESPAASQSGAEQQQQHSETTNSGQQQQQQLANKQQIHRKRISTARILRGIQVQVIGQSESNCNAGGDGDLPSGRDQTTADCQRSTQFDSRQTNDFVCCDANQEDSAIKSDKFAQTNQDREANKFAKLDDDDDVQSNKSGLESQVGPPIAKSNRSSIDLALEGVDELQRAASGGGSADPNEAFQLLVGQLMKVGDATESLGQDDLASSPSNQSKFKTKTLVNQQQQPDGRPIEERPDTNKLQLDEPIESSAASSIRLIGELKQEISNLKTRLVQAQTLNDNLVSELRTTNQQQQQQMMPKSNCFTGQTTVGGLLLPGSQQHQLSSSTTTQILYSNNNVRQQQQQQARFAGVGETDNNQNSLLPERKSICQTAEQQQHQRRSIIYVNGLAASVTHHHHHHHHSIPGVQRQSAPPEVQASRITGNQNDDPNKLLGADQHQPSATGRPAAAVRQQEFIGGGNNPSSSSLFHQPRPLSMVHVMPPQQQSMRDEQQKMNIAGRSATILISQKQQQPPQQHRHFVTINQQQSNRNGATLLNYQPPVRVVQSCEQSAQSQQRRVEELVEFLKFLLDKLHFHHGQTFELANECQKLAMNALLLSYNQQLSLAHHNSAVQAGNQATWQAVQQQQQARCNINRVPLNIEAANELAADPKRQSSEQQKLNLLGRRAATQEVTIRPPPRRRNLSSCFQVPPTSDNVDDHCPSANSNSSEQGAIPNANNKKATPIKQSSFVPLQVAKQTLLALVPSSLNGRSGCLSNENQAQLDSLLVHVQRKCSSNQLISADGNSNKQLPEQTTNTGLRRSAGERCQNLIYSDESIYATVCKPRAIDGLDKQHHHQTASATCVPVNSALPVAGGGVSVLRINNCCGPNSSTTGRQQQQQSNGDAQAATLSGYSSSSQMPTNGNQSATQHQQMMQHSSSPLAPTTYWPAQQAQLPPTNRPQQQRQQQQHPESSHLISQAFSQLPAITTNHNNNNIITNDSQLASFKRSLSEDIERFRVHFNGQLLNLLTRQNWCESLITEKLKAIEQSSASGQYLGEF